MHVNSLTWFDLDNISFFFFFYLYVTAIPEVVRTVTLPLLIVICSWHLPNFHIIEKNCAKVLSTAGET